LHNLRPQNITQNVDMRTTQELVSQAWLYVCYAVQHTLQVNDVDMARTDDSTPAVSFDM